MLVLHHHSLLKFTFLPLEDSTFLQLKMVGAGTPGAICKIQSMENASDILTFNMIPKFSRSVQPFSQKKRQMSIFAFHKLYIDKYVIHL